MKEDATLLTRTLPYNLMAEQMLLGTLLVDNEAMLKVSDFLDMDHFFDPAHKKIYHVS
jgi:replicative DNA helicase